MTSGSQSVRDEAHRLALILLAAGLAAGGGACQRANPAYKGVDMTRDAAPMIDSSPGDDAGSGADAAGSEASPPAEPGTDAGAGDAASDAGSDGAVTAECVTLTDCSRTFGPPPCGAWECRAGTCAVVCAGCVDKDLDGYGSGASCAGPDCDDGDRRIGASGTRSCYSGPAGTMGVGVCRAGTQMCAAGTWGPCAAEVRPAPEACNGEDDDCNGMTDDGLGTFSCGLGACVRSVAACRAGVLGICVPGVPPASVDGCDGVDSDCDGAVDQGCSDCLRVSPGGRDDNGDGSKEKPFRTIQKAIQMASSNDSGPHTVCVAGGPTCSDSYTYQAAAGTTFTMANGVSVFGNYQSTDWSRCPQGPAGTLHPRVTIEPRTAQGVLFPKGVVAPTTLSGFRITRLDGASSGAATAAVTVDGAKGVTLTEIAVDDQPSADRSWGINLVNGAEALVTRSTIYAGRGNVESIGVRAVGAKPVIRGNCGSLDAAERCAQPCQEAGGWGIRGGMGDGVQGDSYGVLLSSSPGAIIEQSAVCGARGDSGAAVRIEGDASRVIVHGSWIQGRGGDQESFGVALENCGGASPWIVGNKVIRANGASSQARVAAIYAAGACHPVIDGNDTIAGDGDGASDEVNGIYCAAIEGASSRCTITGNGAVNGALTGQPGSATAVRCDPGACGRISDNWIEGRSGDDVVGLWLDGTGPFVERNVIAGGCGSGTSAGVFARNAYSRLQNNIVFGNLCVGAAPAVVIGMHVHIASTINELDVHSNFIDGGGSDGNCTSRAVDLGVDEGSPKGPVGIFRNNVLRGGMCKAERTCFAESDTGADPRVFENNDLDPSLGPTALYLDEGKTAFKTAAAVNGLADTKAAGNLSGNPAVVAYPSDLHLSSTSVCIGAGTVSGAPASDFDRRKRDAMPDIGPFEYKP